MFKLIKHNKKQDQGKILIVILSTFLRTVRVQITLMSDNLEDKYLLVNHYYKLPLIVRQGLASFSDLAERVRKQRYYFTVSTTDCC